MLKGGTKNIQVARLLLDAGADVDQKDGNFQTALQAASIRGQTAVAGLLPWKPVFFTHLGYSLNSFMGLYRGLDRGLL